MNNMDKNRTTDVSESVFFPFAGGASEFFGALAERGNVRELSESALAAGTLTLLSQLQELLVTPTNGLPEGNLSEWIEEWCSSGIGETELRTIFGFLEDPANWDLLKETALEVKSEISKSSTDLNNGDFSSLNLLLEICSKKVEIELPRIMPNSKEIRASQTLIKGLLNGKNVLALISAAKSGNPEAALELISIDKLFAIDVCTRTVLTRAAARNDQEFFKHFRKSLRKTGLKGNQYH
jgi:hypothetical protein